jgi:hypothetical protein
MYGAETCRSGINILNILFTSHMNFVGFNSFYYRSYSASAECCQTVSEQHVTNFELQQSKMLF